MLLRKYGESDVRSLPALLAKADDLTRARKIDESDEVTRRAFELARDKSPAYDRGQVTAVEAWGPGALSAGTKGRGRGPRPFHARELSEAVQDDRHRFVLPQRDFFLARTYLSLGKPAAAEPIAQGLLANLRYDDPVRLGQVRNPEVTDLG